jgi:hypothetical protein
MRLRPGGWLSWQLVLLLLLTLVCGGAAGALGATILYLQEAEPLSRELNRRSTRIALLEMLVQQHSPDQVASLEGSASAAAGTAPVPAAPASAAATTAALVTAPAVPARAVPAPAPIVVAAAPAVAPRPPYQVAMARQAPPPAARQVAPGGAAPAAAPAAAEARAEPAEPVTGDELVAAMKARIEGVAGDKAGVKGLEKGAVLLRNGGVVRVGQLFPSGEKLLQVDHENNRVVTTKRQMLLFFSP